MPSAVEPVLRSERHYGAGPWRNGDKRSPNAAGDTHPNPRLRDQRIEKVVRSHVSSRSFIGDYLDAYAIKISHVELAELTANADETRGRWFRGDQLPMILDDAVGFVGSGLHELPWFPSETELRSPEIFVYPWSIYTHGIEPSAVELIFIRPSDKMVFYFGSET